MNRFKLSSLKPSLQIQLFLATLFRLQKSLKGKLTSSAYQKLIMPPPDAYPWEENSGILHQLKYQADYLLKDAPSAPLQSIQELLSTATQAVDGCQTDWDIKLYQLTGEWLQSCNPDENLYFFLLRHQEECKKAFGRVFLLNLFRMKHQNLKQTEQFLIESYQKRGFNHLKSSIRQHLTGLTQC